MVKADTSRDGRHGSVSPEDLRLAEEHEALHARLINNSGTISTMFLPPGTKLHFDEAAERRKSAAAYRAWEAQKEYAYKQVWGPRSGQPGPAEVRSFVVGYIAGSRRRPTQNGLEHAWKAAGHDGRDQRLRAYFSLLMSERPKVGRPRNE